MTYLRIKELATERGLNIQQLSNKSNGVAYSTVLDLWHDRSKQWNRATLDRLATALGVNVCDLFGGTPDTTE